MSSSFKGFPHENKDRIIKDFFENTQTKNESEILMGNLSKSYWINERFMICLLSYGRGKFKTSLQEVVISMM